MMSRQIDLKYRKWRIQIFAITWLAYVGFYLTRKAFSVAKVGIKEDPTHAMDISAMAWIDIAYLSAYAAGQFFWGILGDRVGAKRVILFGLGLSIVTAYVMGVSTIAMLMGVMWLVQGVAQSSGWAPLNKTMCSWFSRHERGRIMGFWLTNYAVGGVAASIFAGWWADQMGSWRWAFFSSATALVVVWMLFLIFQRNKPEDCSLPDIATYHNESIDVIGPQYGDAEQGAPSGSWHDVKATLCNRVVIAMGAAYFLLKPTRYAILLWGPMYVNSRLSSNMTESAWVSGGFEIAGAFSVLLGGLISDKVFDSRRMPVCVLCLLLLSGVLFLFPHLPTHRLVVLLGFMVIGILLYAPDSIVSGTAAQDFGTREGASTAAGFINGCGSIGAIVGGAVPGFMKTSNGDSDWVLIFMILGFMTFAGGAILLPFWKSKPVTIQHEPVADTGTC